MTFAFEHSFHGDIILKYQNNSYNLGHNYVSRLPVMMWLSYLQFRHESIFKVIEVPEFSAEYRHDEELEKILKEAKTVAGLLPLSNDDFNIEIIDFSSFTDGLGYTYYDFAIGEGDILFLNKSCRDSDKEEMVSELGPEDCQSLTREYLIFVSDEKKLGKYQGEMNRIVSELRDVIL